MRTLPPIFSLILALSTGVAAVGCNRESESRAEARALLERLNKLTAKGSLTERQQALNALDGFNVQDPKHAEARDVCRSAHSQLLAAEAAQVSAKKALDEAAKARQAGSPPLSSERGLAIAAELNQSTAALTAAQKEFPKCEQATLALVRESR